MFENVITLEKLITLRDSLQTYIKDLEMSLKSLRSNSNSSYSNSSEWRKNIEQDQRPAVKLVYKELTKAEANLKGILNLVLEATPQDLEFIKTIKQSLEV